MPNKYEEYRPVCYWGDEQQNIVKSVSRWRAQGTHGRLRALLMTGLYHGKHHFAAPDSFNPRYSADDRSFIPIMVNRNNTRAISAFLQSTHAMFEKIFALTSRKDEKVDIMRLVLISKSMEIQGHSFQQSEYGHDD